MEYIIKRSRCNDEYAINKTTNKRNITSNIPTLAKVPKCSCDTIEALNGVLTKPNVNDKRDA